MISFIATLFSAIFFLGILNRVRSFLSGRKGPSVLQTWRDVARLVNKSSIFSTTTSFVFQIAPSVYFATILMAIMVIPLGSNYGIISFDGDFIFFAYILAVGKFFMIISALDTGSPFEGMGANREALYATFAEPAFFTLLGSFAMLTGHYSFYDIFRTIHFGSYESYLLAFLAIYIIAQLAMIENSRMPVDDSRTHLELTMIHEVMILDTSGVDLAMIMTSVSLKFALYGTLITNLLVIHSFPVWAQLLIMAVIQFLWAITVGILESFKARSRMKRNPMIILSLTVLSILIFFGVLILMNKFSLV